MSDPERLAKICGLFSSHHGGERGSAAAKADELVRASGLTWDDVILRPRKPPWPEPETAADKLKLLYEHFDAFSEWERRFIIGVSDFRDPTPKQLAVMDSLVEKVRPLYA